MLKRRAHELGARAYCVHAIFAHGKDTERKRMILRDAMAWHDPPEYYTSGRYLRFEMVIPSQLRLEGGFDIIAVQLKQFRAAMQLARRLNRTLILPRLRCDDRAMAYPCYAWYHRAMGYGGFNFFQKITMPVTVVTEPNLGWRKPRMATMSSRAERQGGAAGRHGRPATAGRHGRPPRRRTFGTPELRSGPSRFTLRVCRRAPQPTSLSRFVHSPPFTVQALPPCASGVLPSLLLARRGAARDVRVAHTRAELLIQSTHSRQMGR